MLIPRTIIGTFSVTLLVLVANGVFGQGYPNRPVRIVTNAAGGGNDFLARLVAEGISGPLGQQVIVENRGSTIVANEVASRANPDGYTMLIASNDLWMTTLLEKVSYDPVNDFSPITLVSMETSVLGVTSSLGVTSVKELIALAKAKPGAINYASSGIGSPPHLAAELFMSLAGIKMVHVPYKGGGPAVVGMLAGEAQVRIGSVGAMVPHFKTGKLRALGVTSPKPSPLFPDYPPIAQSLPGYESISTTVVMGPAKVPTPIINRLNQEIVRVLNRPDVKERLLNTGEVVVASSPEQLAATIKADIVRWGKVIKDAGIKGN